MERYKLKTCLLSDEDLRVLEESLMRSAEDDDVSDEDRARARDLCERFDKKFNVES